MEKFHWRGGGGDGGGGGKQFSLFKESTKLPSSYLVMK